MERVSQELGISGSKTYGGNWQMAGQTIGDFTLAKRDAAIAMERWLTSPSTLNLLDTIYNSVQPWINTFINYINGK